VQRMDGPIFTIYTSYDMSFVQGVVFLGVAMIAPASKIFSSTNFLKLRLIP